MIQCQTNFNALQIYDFPSKASQNEEAMKMNRFLMMKKEEISCFKIEVQICCLATLPNFSVY